MSHDCHFPAISLFVSSSPAWTPRPFQSRFLSPPPPPLPPPCLPILPRRSLFLAPGVQPRRSRMAVRVNQQARPGGTRAVWTNPPPPEEGLRLPLSTAATALALDEGQEVKWGVREEEEETIITETGEETTTTRTRKTPRPPSTGGARHCPRSRGKRPQNIEYLRHDILKSTHLHSWPWNPARRKGKVVFFPRSARWLMRQHFRFHVWELYPSKLSGGMLEIVFSLVNCRLVFWK